MFSSRDHAENVNITVKTLCSVTSNSYWHRPFTRRFELNECQSHIKQQANGILEAVFDALQE